MTSNQAAAEFQLITPKEEEDRREHRIEARRLGRTAVVYAGVTVGIFIESVLKKDIVGIAIASFAAPGTVGYGRDARVESRLAAEGASESIALLEPAQEDTTSSGLE